MIKTAVRRKHIMTTVIGVVVGSQNSSAATAPEAGAADGYPHSIVERRTEVQLPQGVVLDGFVSRVGDPVGMLAADGSTHSGADLMATAIGNLVREVVQRERKDGNQHSAGRSTPITVAYPTSWHRHSVDALRDTMTRQDFGDFSLVTEAVAAMRWLTGSRGSQGPKATVVFDLGATSLDVTVLSGRPGILGTPIRSEDISGAQFDHLIMRYILGSLGDDAIDPFDPATEHALAGVRTRCEQAKKALSHDTETALSLELPGVRRNVRLVRGDLEDVLRSSLLRSVGLISEAIRSAGVASNDVGQVLLAGGGSAIPLVAELISAETGLPVVAAARPEFTATRGAALLTLDRVQGADRRKSAPVPVAATAAARAVTHPATDVIAVSRAGAGAAVATRDPETALRDTDTAVREGVAAAPKPRTVLPRTLPMIEPEPEPTGMSGGRKTLIVAGTVAALTLIGVGALSFGTGATPNSTDTVSSLTAATTTVPPSITTTGAPAPAGAASNAAPTSAAGASRNAVSTHSGAPGGTMSPAGSPAPAPGPSPAPAPQSAPAGTNPPAYTAPPAPTMPSVGVPTVPSQLQPGQMLNNAGNVVGGLTGAQH